MDSRGVDRTRARVLPSMEESVDPPVVQKTPRMQPAGGPSKKKQKKQKPEELKVIKLVKQFRALPDFYQKALQRSVNEHMEAKPGPSGPLESESEESHVVGSDGESEQRHHSMIAWTSSESSVFHDTHDFSSKNGVPPTCRPFSDTVDSMQGGRKG